MHGFLSLGSVFWQNAIRIASKKCKEMQIFCFHRPIHGFPLLKDRCFGRKRSALQAKTAKNEIVFRTPRHLIVIP
jgi:hypothetical protein